LAHPFGGLSIQNRTEQCYYSYYDYYYDYYDYYSGYYDTYYTSSYAT
jgi:hypothetical protein